MATKTAKKSVAEKTKRVTDMSAVCAVWWLVWMKSADVWMHAILSAAAKDEI